MQRSLWPNCAPTTTMRNKKRTPPSLRSALLLASTSGVCVSLSLSSSGLDLRSSPAYPSVWALCAAVLPPPARPLHARCHGSGGWAVGCSWLHSSRCPCPASRCPCPASLCPCPANTSPHTHKPPAALRLLGAIRRRNAHVLARCSGLVCLFWLLGANPKASRSFCDTVACACVCVSHVYVCLCVSHVYVCLCVSHVGTLPHVCTKCMHDPTRLRLPLPWVLVTLLSCVAHTHTCTHRHTTQHTHATTHLAHTAAPLLTYDASIAS